MKKLLLLALLIASPVLGQTNTARMLSGVNAQTGTTYTFVCTDATKLVTFNNASPVTATLFAANDTCSGPGIMFSVKNIGAANVTITPVSGTIDGQASLVLQPGQGADIWNDGVSYTTQGSTSSGPPPAPGFPRLDQVPDQNTDKVFNQGSSIIGFTNGPGMNLSGETSPMLIPLIAGCATTTTGQICLDTTGLNIHGYDTGDHIVPTFDQSTFVSGDVMGLVKVGSHWAISDLGPPSTSGGTPITATITNIQENQSLCWDSTATPPTFINCSPGIPTNVQTGTTYTYDATNDRGAAVISSNVGAQTYTLGQISDAGNFDADWFTLQMNKGAGAITVNTTTSTFDDTGTQSTTVLEGQQCTFITDPSGSGTIYPKCHEPRMTASSPITFTRSPYGLQISCPTCGTGSGNLSGALTSGKVPVASGATTLVDGSILDDLTHAARNDLGYDINSVGRFLWWIPNNTVTGTTVNKAICDDGSNKGIICPSASSTTNNVLGSAIAANGAAPGTSGSTGVCTIGFCSYIMDNSATAGHYAQASSSVNGDLSDVGASPPANSQSYWYIFTGNSGAGTAAIVRNISPSELSNSSKNGGNGKNKQTLQCETGLGDGLNAMIAGTYLQFFCVNKSGVTWTITGINCWTDNAGTSTLNATNNAGTGLLTGAVTCNNTKSGGGAAGTQSATVTLANNDAISFTFVADGTSKQTTWTVSLSQ